MDRLMCFFIYLALHVDECMRDQGSHRQVWGLYSLLNKACQYFIHTKASDWKYSSHVWDFVLKFDALLIDLCMSGPPFSSYVPFLLLLLFENHFEMRLESDKDSVCKDEFLLCICFEEK